MNDAMEALKNEGLTFFGSVNASISHELKNVLAIISETAGLLDDLQQMAQKGGKLDPKMLTTCTQSIGEEIQRGFHVIKQMNRFAHSADTPIKEVSLMESVELAVGLSGFLSYAGRIEISESDPAATPVVMTNPFFLLNLIYRSLIFAYRSAEPGTKLDVAIRADDDAAKIILSGLSANADPIFPDDTTKTVASAIGAEIRFSITDGVIDIKVPPDIQDSTFKESTISVNE